jgi:TetR/AcrR family tetracycline transcriptional repressor
MYIRTCTSYSCQVALTKEAVVENALKIGDTEGLAAVTIRRLANELGVTPMALYWHFKNKDQLFLGMIDELMAPVCVDTATEPWLSGLREQVEALLGSLRAHPYMPELLQVSNKFQATNFARATEIALTFLTRGGLSLPRANQCAAYLLHATSALVTTQPCPPTWTTDDDFAEHLRHERLQLKAYPPGNFPLLNQWADLIESDYDSAGAYDIESYFAFGIDTVLAGVDVMAARTRP